MNSNLDPQDPDIQHQDANIQDASIVDATPPDLVPSIQPLPYHLAVRQHLQQQHPEVWTWFTSAQFREQAADAIRLELLKTTYRLDRDLHGDLYALADQALTALALNAPVTLYQAQGDNGLNAFLAYLPGEAHIGFSGPILKHLTPAETLAIVGHELTHYLFFTHHGRAGLTTAQILSAMDNDSLGDASHSETARLHQLYTEILCDRGAYQVCGDLHVTIAALVKVVTGIAEVSATSYLRQAAEILGNDDGATQGTSHPEVYIRAHALALWAEQGDAAEAEIARLIEGPKRLDRLDLVGQAEVRHQTRKLLTHYLAPPWFHTEAVLAHARLFFSDFDPTAANSQHTAQDHAEDAAGSARHREDFFDHLDSKDQGMRDYLCYLLLDFVALTPELEEAPYAAAFVLADRLHVGDRLLDIARKELGVNKRELVRIRTNAPGILHQLGGER